MKLKISIEFDLDGTSYDVKKVGDLPFTLQNFSSLLGKFHLHMMEEYLDAVCDSESEHGEKEKLVHKAILKSCKDQKKITEQIFNNYTAEGVLPDGRKFVFSHTNPNYKESFTIDGVDMCLSELE
jgi:hypothetical protein